MKEINKNTKVFNNKKKSFGKEKLYELLSKWNPETKEYITDKDLLSGKKLLSDTNGYEDYLTKDERKRMAEVEGNLLYLAQRKKLSNANIYTIAMEHPVSEDTLVGLYQCGAFTLKKVEAYAKQKEMDVNSIKEKIKQQRLKIDGEIDLNDAETWELLTPDERLQIVANYIDTGKAEIAQGRIK